MILLVGETAAAREIGAYLSGKGAEFTRFSFIEQAEVNAYAERFCSSTCSLVVDASHPGQSAKLQPLRRSCTEHGIDYLRLERPETKLPESAQIYPVMGWEQALECLAEQVTRLRGESGSPATVFVTTGSHQLESLTGSAFARYARFVVRVLPEGRLVQKCQNLGIPPRDIVAMQGPFSREVNRTLFKFYGADILLTRDNGPAGGTDTKISAAMALGMEIVLIKKARAATGLTVYSIKEAVSWLGEHGLL